MSNNSGIYRLIFPSGKMYIGQSWDIEKRMYYYSKNRTTSPKLKNGLFKYGFESVVYDILEYIEESQCMMDSREIYWIKELNAIDEGYNLQEGGRGGKHHLDSIKKMSDANKGKRLSPATEFTKDSVFTEEQKQKRAKNCSETKKGVPLTEEHKKALRKPKILTKEQKEANRQRYKGKTWKLINGKRVWLNIEDLINE
jgi:group I intron endonuclease